MSKLLSTLNDKLVPPSFRWITLCGGYEEFMVYVMTTQHIMNVMWGLYAYVMMTPWVKAFRIILGALDRWSPRHNDHFQLGTACHFPMLDLFTACRNRLELSPFFVFNNCQYTCIFVLKCVRYTLLIWSWGINYLYFVLEQFCRKD
jgi:hypothetical protein